MRREADHTGYSVHYGTVSTMTQKQARCWVNALIEDKSSVAYKATELLLYEVEKNGDWDWNDLSRFLLRVAEAVRDKEE